jgi:hypothetical protein
VVVRELAISSPFLRQTSRAEVRLPLYPAGRKSALTAHGAGA